MSSDINDRLRQLIALWIDGSVAGLGHIPSVCEEIATLAARSEGELVVDLGLLERADRLAAKAEQRLSACLEIQTRTGSYSTHGDLERSPKIATAGWEG